MTFDIHLDDISNTRNKHELHILIELPLHTHTSFRHLDHQTPQKVAIGSVFPGISFNVLVCFCCSWFNGVFLLYSQKHSLRFATLAFVVYSLSNNIIPEIIHNTLRSNKEKKHTPLKFNSEFSPEKLWQRKTSLSYREGTFSGAMLNFGRVAPPLPNPPTPKVTQI